MFVAPKQLDTIASEQMDESARRFVIVSHRCFLVYCASAALSIAVSQVALLFAIASWIRFLLSGDRKGLSRHGLFPLTGEARAVARPILLWVTVSLVAMCVGVQFLHAAPELVKSSIYVLLPFVVLHSLQLDPAREKKVRTYLLVLIVSQSIAALHSLFSASFGAELQPRVPGPVTESGQLVLLLPCAISLMVKPSDIRASLVLPVSLAVMLIFAWPTVIPGVSPEIVRVVSTAAIAAVFLWRRDFLSYATALLFAALVVNLKRGPWLAVGVEVLLLGCLFNRRLFLGAVLFSGIIVMLVPQVHSRILDYGRDFTISGGRRDMWELGGELVQRFPLGIGPKNASFMRELNPHVPPMHRHMHNNLLNVAVESGWLGLAAYVWWMGVLITLGFRAWNRNQQHPQAYQALVISAAILGWQVAGLVEYNFGDGEVRLIAFFMMGLLLTCLQDVPRIAPSGDDEIRQRGE